MSQISADYHTKEYCYKEDIYLLQYNLNIQVHKNTKPSVSREIIKFLGIILQIK